MTASSADSGSDGFFAYYRVYARSGVHAASAAALTAFGLVASFTRNRWFILLAIAVYVLPPVFLYFTREGERVPAVVGGDTSDDEHESGSEEIESDYGDDSTTIRETGQETTNRSDIEPDVTTGNSESMVQSTDTADDEPSEPTTTTTDEPDSVESAVTEIDTDEREYDAEPGWTETDTPTDELLLDVVATRNGAYAVGEGGIVLASDGNGWEIALEHGPTADSNSLRGVDATEDGRAIWFAGDSGVLGRDEDGQLTDHSAPKDQTSTWADVAVTGETGAERIHLVNGSGELLRGEYDGGSVSWGDIEKPGSGSSMSAIAFLDSDRGHICDTNQFVYETTDGGESYDTIGIEDANAAFTGVAATDSTVVVAGDNGTVFRYDGAVWTPLQVGSALSAIALTDETGLATSDGGAVCELTEDGWEAVETPTDTDLHGVTIGTDDSGRTDVAVGAAGVVIERQR
jgi:photosystem II stability/assembly factor-like uncharacterized protein